LSFVEEHGADVGLPVLREGHSVTASNLAPISARFTRASRGRVLRAPRGVWTAPGPLRLRPAPALASENSWAEPPIQPPPRAA